MIIAQTEFHISTAGPPIFNNCKVEKDSQLIHCSIATSIVLTGFVWNPDSLDWCTTKEGYYRSRTIVHPPEWKIDNSNALQLLNDNGFVATVPVLDTLEHMITATYLNCPIVSIRCKGTNDKIYNVIYSGYRKIFSSDSIRMIIESNFPASFEDSPKLPKIQDDSSRRNNAILTFTCPSDTSAKMTKFLCNHQHISFASLGETYSASLNSYSTLIPLTQFYSLCKKQNLETSVDHITNDTIFAVFQKQNISDTLKTLFSVTTFLGEPTEINKNKKYYDRNSRQTLDNASLKNSVKIFNLRGRQIAKYTSISALKNDVVSGMLSKGIYLIQMDGEKPHILHQAFSRK